MKNQKRLKAMSMIQIMGAILIAGILTAIAVTKMGGSVAKAKKVEAKNELEHLFSLQRLYHLEHAKYSDNVEDVDYEPSKLITEGGRARYKIAIVEASNTSFTASATSVEDFDGDGVFNIWEINEERELTETQKD
ncbi:type II secretion system GspH family protein [bacterium]|nr:type II secretion system GspH family protein [bacterium]